jgi:hypothetical protein
MTRWVAQLSEAANGDVKLKSVNVGASKPSLV